MSNFQHPWNYYIGKIDVLYAVTMQDALPLADQPHLLQPNARREELFGMPRQPVTVPASGDAPPGVNNPLEGAYACICNSVYKLTCHSLICCHLRFCSDAAYLPSLDLCVQCYVSIKVDLYNIF